MTKQNPSRLREIIEECIRRETSAAAPPPFDDDVVECGAVDSMAWVSVLRDVERATGFTNLDDALADQPRSGSALLAAMLKRAAKDGGPLDSEVEQHSFHATQRASIRAIIAGWGAAAGAHRIPIGEIEKKFALPAGKLERGAGIESVAHCGEAEDETSLGAAACEAALRTAGAGLADVELLVATSETCAGFPQLGAQVHSRLLADGATGVLDVGGACMGLVNAFIVAKGLIESGAVRCALVVTADVHSRVLTPQQVKGEFGGLFGDGASAFVLRAESNEKVRGRYWLGEWLNGGIGAYARAIHVGLGAEGKLKWSFEGEALARAAVERLEQIIADLELRTGEKREAATAFATHQPNPRLVTLLAKQLGSAVDKFPAVARKFGNLGSSTCGTALALALENQRASQSGQPAGPIFLASLAPGLLWSGMTLHFAP